MIKVQAECDSDGCPRHAKTDSPGPNRVRVKDDLYVLLPVGWRVDDEGMILCPVHSGVRNG